MKTQEQIEVFDVMLQVSGERVKVLEVSEKMIGMPWQKFDALTIEEQTEVIRKVVIEAVKKYYPYANLFYWCLPADIMTLQKENI